MSIVTLRAPYPTNKTTTRLPPPRFLNSRKTESDYQFKRTRKGRLLAYPRTNFDSELKLTFRITRQKSLELEAVFNAYQSGTFWLELHDGSTWAVKLTDNPFRRVAIGRRTDNRADETGGETIDVTLTFSGTKLS